MNIDRKISFLDRAIASVKRDRPPDALLGLSERHRALVEYYRERVSPLDRYMRYIEGGPSPELLLPDFGGLFGHISDSDAQSLYQDMIDRMRAHHARQRKDLR